MWDYWWVFTSLGAFVGVAAGMLGIGGGGFIVPVLVVIFAAMGVSDDVLVHMSLATCMASIVATSLSSTLAHQAKGSVLWGVALKMSPGLVLGAYIGTWLAEYLSGTWLSVIFVVCMSYIAAQMVLNIKPKPSRQLPTALPLAGVTTGFGSLSTLLSIGGGTLNVPFLLWCNTPIVNAIGTSAALGVPISISASIGFMVNSASLETPYTIGFVYWPAVLMMSVVSALTTRLGVQLALKLPAVYMKRIFAGLITLLVINMARTLWV